MDFLSDGLFCEWAYFIDFENNKLEVWKGWGYGLAEEISFEELRREGEGFMSRMEKVGRDEEQEEEEEAEGDDGGN